MTVDEELAALFAPAPVPVNPAAAMAGILTDLNRTAYWHKTQLVDLEKRLAYLYELANRLPPDPPLPPRCSPAAGGVDDPRSGVYCCYLDGDGDGDGDRLDDVQHG